MNLVTPNQYAVLKWGKSTPYIYKLLDQGKIQCVIRKQPDGKIKRWIDLDKYPVK